MDSFHSDLPGSSLLHCVTLLLFGRDGTTDVTRTMHFGTPSAYEKVIGRLVLCHWDHSTRNSGAIIAFEWTV